MPLFKVKYRLIPACLLATAIGCVGTDQAKPAPAVPTSPQTSQESPGVSRVTQETPPRIPPSPMPHNHGEMERPKLSPELQPGVGNRFIEPPPLPESPAAQLAIERGETGATGEPLTLETLESIACGGNPTLIQARAQVDGAFGKAIQAGLWPNPHFIYVGEQIGVDSMEDTDTPGEFQGAKIQQKIITADKLDLSRGKFLERTRVAEWLAMAQEYRVLNDVRTHFFRALGRQELVKIHQELLKNAEDNLVTVREMYNYGQATRAEVHQANVVLQEQRLRFLMAENDYREAFETMSTLAGIELQVSPLSGPLEGDLTPIEWDAALARLLEESPEVQAAHAKLRSDQITLKREKVEPIPNIIVEIGAGYNFESSEIVGVVTANVEVPIYDWNQGTVKQAEADLVRQRGEIRRTELDLRRRLAETYRRYLTAFQHVENYQKVILPEARKAYETLLDSYKDDRVQWPTVLEAEREYFQRREEYINNLIAWREAEVLIAGYLLHGGLEAPMDATPPAHIDAVPKPR
jgi:outer membrane protein, heavy metal efflux system